MQTTVTKFTTNKISFDDGKRGQMCALLMNQNIQRLRFIQLVGGEVQSVFQMVRRFQNEFIEKIF